MRLQSDERLIAPSYIPELDGLRGLAIGSVLIYHCHQKLVSSGLDSVAHWGWVGVNLFFVLSGFLITGIILDSRSDPQFFRNFYARRGLRIWPVYVLLLLLNYAIVPFLFGGSWWMLHELRSAPWLHYIFFVQNLFFVSLPGTMGPTWSLAIEEQFYVFWAPVARYVKNASLVPILIGVLILSPVLRAVNNGFLTKTHTLTHLDGLAIGALIAMGLRSDFLSRKMWKRLSLAGIVIGAFGMFIIIVNGSPLGDSFLALGFGGMLVMGLLVTGKRSAYGSFLKARPIKFLGTISYGLYMTHILCFVVIGAFDLKMERFGMWGDLAVVGVRLVLSISFATLLWYGFEKPILKLKRYFISTPARKKARLEPEPVAVLAD